jgi:putative transposase
MRSRYRIMESDGIHFFTCTIVEWIPALTNRATAEMLVASLQYCREHKGLRLYAYVIMDNHLHLIGQAPDIGGVMQDFKRYTARQMVTLAEAAGRDWLVNQFAFYKKHHKRQSQHQVWQEGSHPQLILDWDMFEQKANYIHNNPVRRGWVELPEHWRYSSARNYLLEDHSVIGLDELP